jgi:hypothetical protein
VPQVRGKYNSGDEPMLCHLGCPTFAWGWQTACPERSRRGDPARRLGLLVPQTRTG